MGREWCELRDYGALGKLFVCMRTRRHIIDISSTEIGLKSILHIAHGKPLWEDWTFGSRVENMKTGAKKLADGGWVWRSAIRKGGERYGQQCMINRYASKTGINGFADISLSFS
jgi:hypothetical protein